MAIDSLFSRGVGGYGEGTTGLYARGVRNAVGGTTTFGSGGAGSQTSGTLASLRRRRGRRGYLVNPWPWLRAWWRGQ